MSKLTEKLKMFLWEIPADNKQKFNYPKAIAENFEKIDTNAQEVDTRITSLETNNEENKQEIVTIQEEQVEQKNTIKEIQQQNSYLENILPTGQERGEYIEINDSARYPFRKLNIMGNSIQEGEPTIETPVVIRNCGENDGTINIKIRNQNDFNVKNLIPHKVGGNTNYTVVNTTLKVTGLWWVAFKMKVKKNTNYYVKAKRNIVSGEGGNVSLYDINMANEIKSFGKNDGSFHSGDYEEVCLVFYAGKGANGVCEYSDILFSEIDSHYIQAEEQVLTFPLTEGQVLRKGDYLAEDRIHYVRNKRVFTQNDNWQISRIKENTIDFSLIVADIENIGNVVGKDILCEKLKGGDAYSSDNEAITHIKNEIHVSILKSRLISENLEGFKTWLTDNPLTIEYNLATERVVPYTEKQQKAYNKIKELYSYEGKTYIEGIDEICCNCEVTYVKSLSILINELKTQNIATTEVAG